MISNTEKQIRLLDKKYGSFVFSNEIDKQGFENLKEFLIEALKAEREEVIKEIYKVIYDYGDCSACTLAEELRILRLRLSALGEKK